MHTFQGHLHLLWYAHLIPFLLFNPLGNEPFVEFVYPVLSVYSHYWGCAEIIQVFII